MYYVYIYVSHSSNVYNSITTSTPNMANSTPRRKKTRAPPPPPPSVMVTDHTSNLDPATSMDDVASISSLSSYNSTVHSDQVGFYSFVSRTVSNFSVHHFLQHVHITRVASVNNAQIFSVKIK